ncbi:MAG: hypothetical protein ACREJ5_10860 [Geminicoccaceae bacterium]
MGRSWLLSSLLHGALAVVLWFGLPSWSRPLPAVESGITVELVTEADLGPPEPEVAALAPEPERQAASPEPTPPRPQPEPEAVSEPEPEPEPAPVAEPEPEPEPEIARPEPEPEPGPAPVAEPEPEPEQQAALEPEPPRQQPPATLPKPRTKPTPPPAPEPEPEPAKAAPKPEPEPPQPEAEPAPATPEPPEEDNLAWLRSIEETVQRKQAEIAHAGAGRAREGTGQARTTGGEASLTASEHAALKRALEGEIRDCWILLGGIDGGDDVVVALRIQVRPDRTVHAVTIENEGRLGLDPTYRAVAESARRAVEKCSPLESVAGYPYAVWRDMRMHFDPPS